MTDSFARSTRGATDARHWGLTRRAWFKASGFDDLDLTKPVIGIAQTWSELNHCHIHFRELAEAVKRGVWQAGGWPLEFPTISLGEFHVSPTTMLYRNLLAMDTEEMIRAQPLDGVVLLSSCDKNIPAQLMGAASADRPAILLTGGPMLTSRWNGQVLGACTDCRRLTEELRAGTITPEQYAEIEDALGRSTGHCMVMGTASTMAALAEALGLALPGAVLLGNLCPRGAVIKQSASSPHLLRHRGRAVVFTSQDDLEARIDRPDLDVRPEDVLVLQNAGPVGGPGMPEWGSIAMPRKLLDGGLRDMVRISDARMSGTAAGTVVLHVCPEAAIGGPLALVCDGDLIELDVPARSLNLLVSEEELQRRRAAWQPPAPKFTRGYGRLYVERVLQADEGCDFDFSRPVGG
ncbi:MAG: dihydroxy-acid dehydratase [Gemmataceae bacterium]|nr:dihydroxy-acid dehydratase [Gemmataceae bacterium]